MIGKIKRKVEIAGGTLLVDFEIPEKETSFKAGQHFTLKLINPPYNDAKGNQRIFSIVNSPNENGVLTMTTRISESAFKRSLAELPVGTAVEINQLTGEFLLPEDKTRPLVFIAGGIGITPFISMLRYVQEEKLDYGITLLYSNRNKESTAFLQELELLTRKNPNFQLILTMTEDPLWPGEKRRIDGQLIKDYFTAPNDNTYLIAGPPPMVEAAYKALAKAGVDQKNIIVENFFGY